MTYRNILVPVTGDAECGPAIDAALQLASRFDAHLVGLHVKVSSLEKLPFFDEGLAQPKDISREFANLRRKILYSEEAARTQFEAHRQQVDMPVAEKPLDEVRATASFQVIARRSETTLSEVARVYDLVVMPAVGTIAGDEAFHAVAGVLVGSGRPVLVIPKDVPEALGTNLFVSWNRSAQSARAVAAAAAFIEAASRVTVAYANTGAKAGRTLEELVASLAWRGVAADAQRINPQGESVAQLLVSHAESAGADLMVMGAYSHSRLRDFVLGGVTQQILRNVTLPILMMH